MNRKEINPQLRKSLDALQETPARNPHRRMEGRAQFLQQAENLASSETRSLRERLADRLGEFQGFAHKQWAVSLAGILIALFLTLAGVGGTVYAAQDSLPGEALYPVKTILENVQLRLENDPEDRIQLYSSFANRRIQEIQVMLENGEKVPLSTMVRLEQHTEKMLQETAALKEEQREQVLLQIQFKLQEQSQAMEDLHTHSPEEADPGLQRAQENLQQRLDQIADTLNTLSNGQQSHPGNGSKPDHPQAKPENPGQGKPENKPDHPEDEKDPPQGGPPDNPGSGNRPGKGNPNTNGSDRGH